MKEAIIVGDVHGSIDEFNQLLDELRYDPNKHRLILVGDFLDRGSDPVGLLRQVRRMGIETILGNHEEKCLRWRRYEAVEKLTGQRNPMKPPIEERRKEWLSLSQDDLQWLSNLPLKIHIKDNWYVVHAGLEPGVDFNKQDIKKIIRIRYVDEDGFMVKAKGNKEKPEATYFWAERWNQPYNIIFGHQRFDEPQVFKNENNICVGIDLGCCFGHKLCAYNLDRDEFTQVKAKKIYYQRGRSF